MLHIRSTSSTTYSAMVKQRKTKTLIILNGQEKMQAKGDVKCRKKERKKERKKKEKKKKKKKKKKKVQQLDRYSSQMVWKLCVFALGL